MLWNARGGKCGTSSEGAFIRKKADFIFAAETIFDTFGVLILWLAVDAHLIRIQLDKFLYRCRKEKQLDNLQLFSLIF